ncbi:MAG: carboxypeptidase-like regulatory domain-containing protein, partial [Smithellaceae bacterium]
MKKKSFFLFFLLLLCAGASIAQTRVSGKVIDENGDPIIGATIQIKGTGQGTVTDLDGNFTLSAPADGTLVISYVGMKTQEVSVAPNLQIVMQSASELLEEVVVVGYGSQRRENLTGAVSSVDVAKTLNSRPIPDVGRGLQ